MNHYIFWCTIKLSYSPWVITTTSAFQFISFSLLGEKKLHTFVTWFLQHPLVTSSVISWMRDIFLCYWVTALAPIKVFWGTMWKICTISNVNFISELPIVLYWIAFICDLTVFTGKCVCIVGMAAQRQDGISILGEPSIQLAKVLRCWGAQLRNQPSSDWKIVPDALQTALADRTDYSDSVVHCHGSKLIQELPFSAIYLIFFSLQYYQNMV